ncbi:MAG: hypothetical protein JSR46_07175, partial [Verrucomicrobia bacterium]|nr:hypothetical protein [Verrucomicrobiota bacterium]
MNFTGATSDNIFPDEVLAILLPFLDTIYDMEAASLVSGRWYKVLHAAWEQDLDRAQKFTCFLAEETPARQYLSHPQGTAPSPAPKGLLEVMSAVHELKRRLFTALNSLIESEFLAVEKLSQRCERPKTCCGIFELVKIYKIKSKEIPYAYNQAAALPQIVALWMKQGYCNMAITFTHLIDNTKKRNEILDGFLARQYQDDIDKNAVSRALEEPPKSVDTLESSQKLRDSAIDLMMKDFSEER